MRKLLREKFWKIGETEKLYGNKMQFLSGDYKRNEGRNAVPSEVLDGTQSETLTFIKLKRF